MAEKESTRFGDRLTEALHFSGYFNRNEQVLKVAAAAEVTTKTATRYLALDKCPMKKYPIRLLSLSKALNCNFSWLYSGDGLSPYDESIAKSMALMTEYEKRKFLRMAIRMVNKDSKVKRAINLFDAGFISKDQFFSMM